MDKPSNFRALIAYDGSYFFGWQKTKTGPSVEEALEKALLTITGCPAGIQAASRTDRGVHALGQVVNFFLPHDVAPDKLREGLNAVVAKGISILHVERAELSFHPTLDAQAKEYHYFICNAMQQLPFHRKTSWHFPQSLDLDIMRKSAAELLGRKNFSAFTNAPAKDPWCQLERISLVELPGKRLRIELVGNRFLYKMARNLVGTLVHLGSHKLPSSIPEIFAIGKRRAAGTTAPALGLFLKEVFY